MKKIDALIDRDKRLTERLALVDARYAETEGDAADLILREAIQIAELRREVRAELATLTPSRWEDAYRLADWASDQDDYAVINASIHQISLFFRYFSDKTGGQGAGVAIDQPV